MNEEDLFAELEKADEIINEQPKQEKSFNRGGSFTKRKWPWEEEGFKPKKIDINNFNKSGKYFSIAISSAAELTDDIINKFTKIAQALFKAGYTFRHCGDSSSKVNNEIMSVEGSKVESHLPWKKFNENIKNPVTFSTTKESAELVAYYHSGFNKLPIAVKGILSSEMYCALGKDLNNPLDLYIIYSPKGHTSLGTKEKPVSFKELGNTSFPIRVAGAAGIAVFNLGNETAITEIVEFLKAKNSVNNQ